MGAIALEIHTRAPVLDGQPFGQAGAYEKIAGVLRFAVDPDDPRHRAITDLPAAPRSDASSRPHEIRASAFPQPL